MCGIAGIISANPQLVTRERLQMMADRLSHRGPDGEGFYLGFSTPGHYVGMAHRRLAILDLSDAASQPMVYENRYWIVYNGEIYNYIELRDYLEKKGFAFRTRSDTEVILASYVHFKEKCVHHFDGMFAFAIWDEANHQLFCARDRFGEKPFFYHFNPKTGELLFASEMKALWAVGAPREPNYKLLYQYLTLGFTYEVHFPDHSFYDQIWQLPPGQFLKYQVGDESLRTESYWDLDKETMIETSDTDAIERFQELFQLSIHRRQRSDVPIGTSLSGGLDSSSIVSACHHSPGRLFTHHTFSAVFPGFEKDESDFIRLVNASTRSTPHWVSPSAEDFIKDIENLFYHQEEPFGSASVYAQFCVYRESGENQIRVLLDGQGADEVLAGYQKYFHWHLQEMIGQYQFSETKNELRALRQQGIRFEWGIQNYIAGLFPALASSHLERKAYSQQKSNPDISPEFQESFFQKGDVYKPIVDKLNDILYFDTMVGGLRELLRYADRNAMAHGCEVRLPFLHHELVQYLFSLPSYFKIREGYNKWILRKSMDGNLPPAIINRTDKVGFEPPQRQWMEDPKIQESMNEGRKKLIEKGILRKERTTKKIQPQTAYAAENYDWRYWLAAMMLERI